MFLVCVELLGNIKPLCKLEHPNKIYVGAILFLRIYCTRLQSPSPGHPSTADEAWYWLKHVPYSGQLYIPSRGGRTRLTFVK